MNPWPRDHRLVEQDKVPWGFVAFTVLVMVIAGIAGYYAVKGMETLLAKYTVATADQHTHQQQHRH